MRACVRISASLARNHLQWLLLFFLPHLLKYFQECSAWLRAGYGVFIVEDKKRNTGNSKTSALLEFADYCGIEGAFLKNAKSLLFVEAYFGR